MDDERKITPWIVYHLVFRRVITTIGLLPLFFPQLIPFHYFQFWKFDPHLIVEGILTAWPLYLLAIVLNGRMLFKYDGYETKPREILLKGFLVSLRAGIVEELAARWLMFFGFIVLLPLLDWLLSVGGIHWIQWLNTTVVCPVADFFTFGYLHSYLMDTRSWVIGAAIICANGQFRNGHFYLGAIGVINAWFMGMAFFWIMFNYGLPAAMLAHGLYDLTVFVVIFVDAELERFQEAA